MPQHCNIAVTPAPTSPWRVFIVDLEQARSFGVISVDANDQVVSFDETPDQPAGIPGGSGHRPPPGRLVDPDRRRAASAGTLIIGKGYQFA